MVQETMIDCAIRLCYIVQAGGLHARLLHGKRLVRVVDSDQRRRVQRQAPAECCDSLHDAGRRQSSLRVVIPAFLHRVAHREEALREEAKTRVLGWVSVKITFQLTPDIFKGDFKISIL